MSQTIEVRLVGGPSGVPDCWEIDALHTYQQVKVPRLGGYEHFDPTGTHIAHDGCDLPVYQWSYRTRIAE
ncbi:DUF5988 family protein [Nocardia sp. CA-128927]|uniref:DUF5988 family protein n=1 Tax=Nocardia sp. CA-128927 TaxID=3239975 RepID=UPI003D977D24